MSIQPSSDAGVTNGAGVPEVGKNGQTAFELHKLLHALQAMRAGDFSVRLPGDHLGIEGKIADTFNEIAATNERMAQQLDRVGQVVGKEGKTKQRVKLGASGGAWAEMENSVNTLIDDLLWPTREVTRAVAAVASGESSAALVERASAEASSVDAASPADSATVITAAGPSRTART